MKIEESDAQPEASPDVDSDAGQEDAENSKPIRIMVVDTDGKFANSVKREFVAAKEGAAKRPPKPVFTDTVRQTQSLLSDRDFAYAGIFVNPVLGSPGWLAIIRASHQYRTGTPVFVIYDTAPKISPKEVKSLGVQGFIKKPLTYQKMLELVSADSNADTGIEPDEATPAVSKESKEEAPDSSFKEGDFVPVALDNMHGTVKSLFDLYVKLGPGKFVKVLRSGDILSAERIETYKKKGATELFVTKKSQGDYLAFCDSMIADMLKDESVSVEVKADQVMGQGASVLSFIQNAKFSEESLQKAQQYVANSTELLKQVALKSDVVKNLLNDVASREHGVACATLAGLMIKYIGAQSAQIYDAIGIACFMHDIALVGQPQVVLDEDDSKMTPEQQKIFYAHPEEGAKIIKKLKGVPPIVSAAVAQHHLRANKQGFPKEKAVAEVNKIAELIGICEEFVNLVKAAEKNPEVKPFEVLKEKAEKDFSQQIVSAFVRTFTEK